MVDIRLIPPMEFQRIRDAGLDKYDTLSIIADMSRLNTLCVVKRAGSGHLGTSFSAMDLFIWVKLFRFKTNYLIWIRHGPVVILITSFNFIN